MTSQTEADSVNAPAVLPRRFGLLQATALNMSTMIGVGPFITIRESVSTEKSGSKEADGKMSPDVRTARASYGLRP